MPYGLGLYLNFVSLSGQFAGVPTRFLLPRCLNRRRDLGAPGIIQNRTQNERAGTLPAARKTAEAFDALTD